MKLQRIDPRIARTHKYLREALAALLREKSFDAITINEIAGRAGINRATVYKHFADKFAILDAWVGEEFQQRLVAAAGDSHGSSGEKLAATIGAACGCMTWLKGLGRSDDRLLHPIADARMRIVLLQTVEFGFEQKIIHPVGPRQLAAPMATAVIHAAAEEWARSNRSKGLKQHVGNTMAALVGFVSLDLDGVSK